MSISSLREISILVSRYHVRFFFYTVVRSTCNSIITSINKVEEIPRCMHRWQIWCNRKKREICIDRYSKKYNKNFLMWNRYHIIIEYFMRVILFFFLIKLLLVIRNHEVYWLLLYGIHLVWLLIFFNIMTSDNNLKGEFSDLL